jgi:hypothetical protein
MKRESCSPDRQIGNKNSTHSLARARAMMDLWLLLQMAHTLKPILSLSWLETASLTTLPILPEQLLAVYNSGVGNEVSCQNRFP